MNDRRIDDRTSTDHHTRTSQVRVDRPEDALAQTMLFQEMTKLADGRLVRNPFLPEINTDERSHRVAVVEGLFHGRVAEVEPVLQEVHSQHSLDADRRSSRSLSRWIMPLHHLAEAFPGDHLIHFVEKLSTLRRLAVTLKTSGRKSDLLVRHKQILSQNCAGINQAILS